MQTYICYTHKHLFRGGPIDLALQELQLSDRYSTGESTGHTQLLRQAILSLAMGFFGSQHQQSAVLDRGYAMHGVTLRQLNHTLSNPKCYLHDDVLLSVLTLTLLEIFTPTGREHYLKHISGLEKLYELRGPTAYYSPQSIQIYKSVRLMIILASLSSRKGSILAGQEWKDFLRNNSRDNKLEEQYLFNVLADCSVVFEEHDQVMVDGELEIEDGAYQRDEVTRKALDLLEQLQLWKERWDSERPNFSETVDTSYRLQPMQGTCDRNVASFATIFTFTKTSTATLLMLYNATLIFVLRVLSSLSLENLGLSPDEYSPALLLEASRGLKSLQGVKGEYAAAERSAALEICR
jgi:hypothetical protein